MYLSSWDMFAVIIALSISLTLIVTTSVANARLTRSRNAWRKSYYQAYEIMRMESVHTCTCAECD
jgi:hypothetical protein